MNFKKSSISEKKPDVQENDLSKYNEISIMPLFLQIGNDLK